MVSQASCLIAEWEQQLETRRHIYTSTRFCLQWNEGQSGLPRLCLVICLLPSKIVHQKSISEAQFPENIKLEIFFHYFLSCLKSVCPSSCPRDPSMAEIRKQVFSDSLSSWGYMLTGIEIQRHRHLVDIVTSDASVLTLYYYFLTLTLQ